MWASVVYFFFNTGVPFSSYFVLVTVLLPQVPSAFNGLIVSKIWAWGLLISSLWILTSAIIPLEINSSFTKLFTSSLCTFLSRSLGRLNKTSVASLGDFVLVFFFSILSTWFQSVSRSVAQSGVFSGVRIKLSGWTEWFLNLIFSFVLSLNNSSSERYEAHATIFRDLLLTYNNR